jgi:hypothetical protein
MNTQTTTQAKNYIRTDEKIEVKDYPYSFNLRTTLFDFVEFNERKGYRRVTQTINPKTNRENKPKKSVYSPLLVRFYDDIGHIKAVYFDFNGDKAINKGCEFLAENFGLFAENEIKYFYSFILSMAFVDMKATAIYGGSDIEKLKPLYADFFALCKEGLRTGENLFSSMKLDSQAIDKTKPENFNPFVVKSYTIA